MKKIMIILAIAVMAVNANAQLFIGGQVGINAAVTGKSYDVDINRDYLVGFTIAPKIGYYFNEKLAFGFESSIGADFFKTSELTYDPYHNFYYFVRVEGRIINWRVAPFLRYSVFTHKKFALALEGTIGAGGTHANYYNSVGYYSQKQNHSIFTVGVINIAPVLCYKFTERLQLEAILSFLNLGYNIDIIKSGGEIDLLHDVNIGFNTKSVFVMSQFAIGVIYKFK